MTKYKANAGQCEKCRYYKTWDVTIKNPRTGKTIPAHIKSSFGEDAEMLDDGQCPWWKSYFSTRKHRHVFIKNPR